MSATARASYTWDDFIALDDDDRRELIDGELVEVEVPATWTHENIVMMLGYFLTAWSQAGHGGRAIGSCYKVRISEKRGVMPDVQFYARGNNAGKEQDKGLVGGRPDLVVEVISPSSQRYDRVTKLHWYAQIGVPEYWIIDPPSGVLEQLVLRDGHYVILESLTKDDVFRPSTFEGLEIPLAKLWGEDATSGT